MPDSVLMPAPVKTTAFRRSAIIWRRVSTGDAIRSRSLPISRTQHLLRSEPDGGVPTRPSGHFRLQLVRGERTVLGKIGADQARRHRLEGDVAAEYRMLVPDRCRVASLQVELVGIHLRVDLAGIGGDDYRTSEVGCRQRDDAAPGLVDRGQIRADGVGADQNGFRLR